MRNKRLKMQDMPALKIEMKERIDEQQARLVYSATHLLPPINTLKVFSTVADVALATSGLVGGSRKIGKGFKWINGLLIGYKLSKSVIGFIRGVKK